LTTILRGEIFININGAFWIIYFSHDSLQILKLLHYCTTFGKILLSLTLMHIECSNTDETVYDTVMIGENNYNNKILRKITKHYKIL